MNGDGAGGQREMRKLGRLREKLLELQCEARDYIGCDGINVPTSLLDKVTASVDSCAEEIGFLRERIEFSRLELMLEFSYACNGRREPIDLGKPWQVLSPQKLSNAQESRIRINLGCGHKSVQEFINIDYRELPGVDVVAEIGNLPFRESEVYEIYSSHLLEHFPQERLRRELLPYFRRLLRPDGIFRAVVPDAEAMIKEYSKSNYSFEILREVTFGSQEYAGDFHFNMFTPSSLKELLESAGFAKVKIIDRARVNGACFEFDIMAAKGGEVRYDSST